MKKIINLVAITFMCFISLSTVVFATDIDMNLEPTIQNNATYDQTNTTNTTGNTAYDNTLYDEYTYEDDYDTSYDNSFNQSTTVSSVSSVTEETFGISHVLNIFLIVVGVILILLGIAILIRLK